jgi:hypothetical protein
MNNQNAQTYIDNCLLELQGIEDLINGLGHLSRPVPYLTKYAVIKSCGTIESCFKTIISDTHSNQSSQIQNYIDKTIRESSMNPNQKNICSTLNRFDINWNTDYKQQLNSHSNSQQIKDSLKSLNEARNTFAHGGNVNQTFQTIKAYFIDSVEVIKIIDNVIG